MHDERTDLDDEKEGNEGPNKDNDGTGQRTKATKRQQRTKDY